MNSGIRRELHSQGTMHVWPPVAGGRDQGTGEVREVTGGSRVAEHRDGARLNEVEDGEGNGLGL